MSQVQTVTIEQFRVSCERRLDDAVAAGEAKISSFRSSEGYDVTVEAFETPTGLELTRIMGNLSVHTDLSELGDDAVYHVVDMQFFAPETNVPPQVTEDIDGDKRAHSTTFDREHQDFLATELSKYVTLVI